MKTTCIRHPERNPLLLIRQWQVEFCDENYCAAALLSVFEFFHNYKIEQSDRARHENDIAERHGDPRNQNESQQQFYNYKELADRLLGLYAERTISEAIRFLAEKGVITIGRNPNQRYKFDKTNFYLFHPEVCNHWLDQHYFSSSGGSSPTGEMSEKISGPDNLLESEVSSCSKTAASIPSKLPDQESHNTISIPAELPDRAGNFASWSSKKAAPSAKLLEQ